MTAPQARVVNTRTLGITNEQYAPRRAKMGPARCVLFTKYLDCDGNEILIDPMGEDGTPCLVVVLQGQRKIRQGHFRAQRTTDAR